MSCVAYKCFAALKEIFEMDCTEARRDLSSYWEVYKPSPVALNFRIPYPCSPGQPCGKCILSCFDNGGAALQKSISPRNDSIIRAVQQVPARATVKVTIPVRGV